MPCSIISRTKTLFSSSKRQCQAGGHTSGEETDALLQKEPEFQYDEDTETREIPFPCPAFINTASKYILTQTPSQHISIPKSSSYSRTPHHSQSQAHQARTIDPTPLALAFADLAVDAGIYGTRDSYVEVLAFQLRRMVRSLARQCEESKGKKGGNGFLTLTVARPELNCSVHITIQTRHRTTTHHPILSRLNRVVDEQVVILGLKPLVSAKPESLAGDLECREEDEGEDEAEGEGEDEGVFSTWWWKESRFGGCAGGDKPCGEWRVARGRDAWWDLYDCCKSKRVSWSWRGALESGCEKGKFSGKRGTKRGCSRMEVSLGEGNWC
ncbi:hypothetical protein ONS95_003689 [Cadophora gregata]|uniref:uncharacterized protein n=1 Tax=Cadophora gregata TaxID=51156 RepID=UPI0026DD7B31|nr:uncharacterized protein ONS95_003689 [Cadophora gregata]KAK0106974.1 hypothetical protein ONS95_003689 [Cadophora gregata]